MYDMHTPASLRLDWRLHTHSILSLKNQENEEMKDKENFGEYYNTTLFGNSAGF